MENLINLYRNIFDINGNSLKEMLDDFQKSIDQRSEYELGFNIFSLVSDTYHKENLHSAILKSILDPHELHNEGNLYLRLFIEYLNKEFGYEIKIENYKNVTVTNETDGRIDIIIKSATHAIIIENKINDAGDMENQVLRYYLNCIYQKLEVDAILYLTKEGIREPKYDTWTNSYDDKEIFTKEEFETSKSKIKNILKPIACFNLIETNDLCNGWLNYCIGQSKHIDNIFILKQYKQLLKHLRQFIMEKESLKKLYNHINKQKSSREVSLFIESVNTMIEYFPELLVEKLKEINKPIKIYEETSVIIDDIFKGNKNYYLKIAFLTYNSVEILIMNNKQNWTLDEELRKNQLFLNLNFSEQYDKYWDKELKNINLFEENTIDNIVEDIKTILSLGL